MTSAYASLLMNKFFDDEATDADVKDLFLHLGAHDRDRATFTAMKRVNDTLAAPQEIRFPHAIDTALSSLAMGAEAPVLSGRTVTGQQASVLLSGFVAFLLAAVVVFMAAKMVVPSATFDRDPSASLVYARSVVPSHSSTQ